ncbi:9784_t:CDS:2, partial [Dentiscutata erythropus]
APEVLKELDHGKHVDMWAIDSSLKNAGKEYLKEQKLLNVDPDSRFTAHQALNHSWFCEPLPNQIGDPPRRFNAHRIFKKAVNTIRVINDLSHANSSNIVNLLEESRMKMLLPL